MISEIGVLIVIGASKQPTPVTYDSLILVRNGWQALSRTHDNRVQKCCIEVRKWDYSSLWVLDVDLDR